MSCRNNQKQIWADKQFIAQLESIRAKRILANQQPIKNIGDLTKLITKCESFKNVEEELLKIDISNTRKKSKKQSGLNLNIKFDGGFF